MPWTVRLEGGPRRVSSTFKHLQSFNSNLHSLLNIELYVNLSFSHINLQLPIYFRNHFNILLKIRPTKYQQLRHLFIFRPYR
jgi:hypothetical protein